LYFWGLKGHWKVAFDHSFRPCIRIYTEKSYINVLYGVYIRWLKFTNGHTSMDTEKIICTSVYIRYVYIRRIYTYTVLVNPKNVWQVIKGKETSGCVLPL
jgi:hypothetical protein